MSTQKTFSLTFLGTCACEFSPKLDNEYKDSFDYDARRSSSVIFNEKYLIDCGVHTPHSLKIANCDKKKITDIFITHLHYDHFIKENVEAVAGESDAEVRLWVREDAELPNIENVTVMRMKKFEKYDVGEGLSVIGMPANHAPSAFPQHFVFEKDGKKFYYGCDGGWFLNETFIFMKNINFDLMIIDATCGDYLGDFRIGEHNTIPMIRTLLPSLLTVKAIREDTEIYLSHLAPSLHKPHAQTEEIARGFGAHVAYDGLSIDI